MIYLFFICGDPAKPAAFDPDVQQRHGALERELRDRGVFEGGAGFMPASMAKTVRMADGKAVVRDGVAPDAREAVGGFYAIECRDEEEALSYAARIPVPAGAWVEVRQAALWHGK